MSINYEVSVMLHVWLFTFNRYVVLVRVSLSVWVSTAIWSSTVTVSYQWVGTTNSTVSTSTNSNATSTSTSIVEHLTFSSAYDDLLNKSTNSTIHLQTRSQAMAHPPPWSVGANSTKCLNSFSQWLSRDLKIGHNQGNNINSEIST